KIPLDSLPSTVNLVERYNYREQNLSTDYTKVLFTLNLPGEFDKDIYIVGNLTDWKMLPEYKMVYDDRVGAYVCSAYLKQGYYNYEYAIPGDNGKLNFEDIEGNWYSTENAYTILTYYRPRGGQYDQLVGVHTFNAFH